MKKLLIVLVLGIFVAGSLFANGKKDIEPVLTDISPTQNHFVTNSTDDTFDEQFQFPCDPGSVGQAGVESDGEYIYTTIWSAAGFCRYDLDGTFLGEFTVAGASNVRDLAYDGEYFYGGAASNTVFIMDFANETLIGTITAPVAVRAIGYDEAADGFWANNWSDEITLFDRNGALINSFPCTTHSSYYGFAYDDVTSGGPFLWGASQDNAGSDIVQIEIATGAETGVMFDASGFGSAGGICGGLYITDEIVPGYWTLGGIVQNETIWGVELAVACNILAPAAATDFVVTPDPNGGLTAELGWFNPSLNVNGEPLTELTEMNVLVDGEVVETILNPTIGGFESYSAILPIAGMHLFQVQGVNSYDPGILAGQNVWIGDDVPAAVEELDLLPTGGNGNLSWINPTLGSHGGPLIAPILGYHITRNDGAVFEVTGLTTVYVDTTIPAVDSYNYEVVPYNASGDGDAATSNIVMIGLGDLLFGDDFENGIDDWEMIVNSGQGEWVTYSEPYPNGYTMPATSMGSTVISADSDETGSGTTTDCTLRLASPLDCSDCESVAIMFDNDWNAIADDDFCYVNVSVDGTTWENVLTFDGTDVRNTTELIDVTEFVAGESQVWIEFHSVQPGWDWWWTIDNVGVYAQGGGNPPVAYGDVDDNGDIQALDAALTLQAAVGLLTFEPWQIERADVDLNGVVQAIDASLILQYVVGLIPELPWTTRSNINADVKVTIEGNELVFTTTGDLYGFQVNANDMEFSNIESNLLFAQKDNAIAIASAEALTGEFLRIPFNSIGEDANLEMIINTEIVKISLNGAPVISFTGQYPNPFNPVCYFGINSNKEANAQINIYNIKGAKVATLNEKIVIGQNNLKWNAVNKASGVYFYKINVEGNISSGKMLLLK